MVELDCKGRQRKLMHIFEKKKLFIETVVFVTIGLILAIPFANTSFSYAKIKGYKNINEWEEKVVKEGSKKLTYRGRVYYAYQEHVDELLYYLNKKEIDLNQADAEDAIRQLNDPSNAKQGAMQGYLYQIGGKPKKGAISTASDYDGKVYKEFNKKVRFKNEEEYKKSKLYKNNKQYIDTRQTVGYKNLDAMREEIREISQDDREYESILRTRSGRGDIEGLEISESSGLVFLVIEIVLLLIVIVLFLRGKKEGTMPSLNKFIPKNTHEDRKRIRKSTSIILVFIIAFELIVTFTGITYSRTIGSNSYIDDAMELGGVYQSAYMGFREDVHKYLKKNKVSQNALDLAMPYRNYMNDFKNVNNSSMRTGNNNLRVDGIKDIIKDQVKLMAYVVKKDSKQITKKVDVLYKRSMSNETGMFIYEFRNSIGIIYKIALLIAWITLFLSTAILVLQKHHPFNGLKDVAKGTAFGTFLWGVITAYMALMFDGTVFSIESDNAYVTVQKIIEGLSLPMSIMFAGGTLLTVLLFSTYLIEKKRH